MLSKWEMHKAKDEKIILEGTAGGHVSNLFLKARSAFGSDQAAQSWIFESSCTLNMPRMGSAQPPWTGCSTAWLPHGKKDFLHGQSDSLLFQLKPVVSFTHTTVKNLPLLFWVEQAFVRTLKPSILQVPSLSLQCRWSSHWPIVAALHWTCASLSITFLYWGSENGHGILGMI